MKKIRLFLLLTFFAFSSGNKASEVLNNFVKDFDQYYPHPSWMVKQYFLKMNLDEVRVAFSFLVNEIYKKGTRWHYLYDAPTQFKEDEQDRKDLLNHFEELDLWLSKIVVDKNDNSFTVIQRKLDVKGIFELNGRRVILLKEYLRSQVPQYFADFYALYYKYLSEEFFDTCKKATSDAHKDKVVIFKSVIQIFNKIEAILTKCLMGTKYEKDALYQFERYELVLSMFM